MRGQTKRPAADGSYIKQKKHKKAAVTVDQMLETEVSTFETADLLDFETIREGMLILGCVTEIKPTFLEMSLPGFLFGRVLLNNISDPFTKSLKDFAANVEMEEPSHSFIKVGMIFPCKVIEISRDSSKKKSSITLSINPVDINVDLKPSLLYPKMVLYVSVSSIEDHGCVVDVGNKYIKGFLSKQYYQDHRSEFEIGEVIPTILKQVSSDKTSARIQLSLLDFTKPFPTVSVEDIKLASILPGMKILGDVIDVKHPFIYIKYQSFDACASILSIGPSYTAIKIGNQVCGTVLYTHPITHMIYLSLNLKPEYFESEYFGLRKYAIVENLKFYSSYKKFAYYVIKKGTLGFFNVNDLPKSSSNEKISKACVLRCHYMDNLVQLSAKSSLLEQNIIFPDDVQIGDIYEATVSKHVYGGMFVKICPGLSGFVQRIYMSDVFVTKPEVLHPVGTKVNCRVLSTDGKGKLDLTCKESLLRLQHQFILSSYEVLHIGQFYKGVIAQKTDDYTLVLFFNGVKGIVPSSYVPVGSILFEGQTVLCEVVYCNALKKKLRLALEVEQRFSLDEIDDFWDESTENEEAATDISNKVFSLEEELVHYEKIAYNVMGSENPTSKTNNKSILTLDQSLSLNIDELRPKTNGIKAVIQSIKGSQLNIIVGQTKGRVHVTELGCTSENTCPLKHFEVGQEIQVYVIGEFMEKKNNYLEISHKNYISFKECSMRLSPFTESHVFRPGEQLMGFVKEVHDVSIVLWLTPYQIGVLDYLHFSENLKTLKSLPRHLKIGLSIKVTVLENKGSTVILRKTDKTVPQPGRNTIGLVQIPCSERGLVLKLPFGYHGSVAVTDLTDVYSHVPILLQKYSKFKFLKCHVLEVNHETKYCQLSLRKSRMYGKATVSSAQFCPEISEDNIKVESTLNGFVKSISDSAVIVSLGRNLDGKIPIHTCSSNCHLCEISRNIIDEHPVESIVKVTVKKCFKDGRLCILNLTASETSKNDECNRLNIEEDISWDE